MEILAYFLMFIAFLLLGYIIFVFFRIKNFEDEPKEWKDLPKSLRVYLWIGRNYKPLLIALFLLPIIANALLFFLYSYKEKEKILLTQSIKNMADKVLVLYPNGKIASLYLSDLKPRAVRYYLDDIVLAYFIWGKTCLFKGGNFATSYKEIPKYCDRVRNFLRLGLLSRKGLLYYAEALKGIYALAKADQLPEVIKPEDINSKIVIKKEGDKLIFDYSAKVKTYLEFTRLGEKGINYGSGIYEVKLQGEIDPEKGNLRNPFGVKIDYVSLSPPVKPSY